MTIIRPPEWNGRRRYWENPNWCHTPELDVAIGLFRQQNKHGWVDKYFLLVKKLGEPIVQPVFVLALSFLTTTGTNTTNAGVDASWNNNNNTIECIGGGGAGAHGASTSTGGGGGAGGGYNRISNFVIANPGTSTFTWAVGAAGLAAGTFPQNGGDSWFNSAAFPTTGTAVGAKGGPSPATNTTATGGTAVATTSFYPTTSPPARVGGNGASGTSATVGGGGGGAGGPNGVGGNASTNTGGTADGGTVTGGAAGNPGTSNNGTEWDSTHGCGSGAGGSNASGGTGGTGGRYGGGGGGGSRSNGVGGNGFQGIVVLTWTPVPSPAEYERYKYRGEADYVPPPDWIGQPIDMPSTIRQVVQKPTVTIRDDFKYLTEWQGQPIPMPMQTLGKFRNQPTIEWMDEGFDPPPPWRGTPIGQPSAFNAKPPPPPLTINYSVGQSGYVYDSDIRLWQGKPIAPNYNLKQLQPFYKLWRYDYEPDKYWQGEPEPSIPFPLFGIRPFSKQWEYHYHIEQPLWLGVPIAIPDPLFMGTAGGPPFHKQWRYDYQVEYPQWQGQPDAIPIMFMLKAAPFFKQWRYDFAPETYWQGQPEPSTPLPLLGIKPFSEQWEYNYDSDVKLWVGSPIAMGDPLFILSSGGTPFSKQTRFDLTELPQWVGTPEGSPIVSQQVAAPFFKDWAPQYTLEPDKQWLGVSTGIPDPLFILTAGGQPFFRQWRYDLVPDPVWQGAPQATNVEFFPFVEPFSKLWRYDLVPQPDWVGTPQSVSDPLFILTAGGPPTHKLWRYDYDVDRQPLWQRSSTPSSSLFMLVEGGSPVSNDWFIQYTYNTEYPQWQGTPLHSASIYLTPIEPQHVQWASQTQWDSDVRLWQRYSVPSVTLLELVEGGQPFHKQWRYDYFTEYPQWQGAPTAAYVLTDLAAKPYNKQLWRYDYDSGATVWQGAPIPTNPEFFPFVFPFTNEWSAIYSYDSDVKLWQGRPTPTNVNTVPTVAPFSNEWFSQGTIVPEPFWQGKPLVSWTLRTPIFVPFSNEWSSTYTFEPDKLWTGTPLASHTLTDLARKPTSPTKQWHYDYASGEGYWQGAPTPTLRWTIPLVVPFSNEWFQQYTFEPDKYWVGRPLRAKAVVDLAYKPTSPTKQWHWDADFNTWWQGQPVPIPGFLIPPIRFVFDPDSQLPHVPIWPGRKEHIPWFVLDERRRDPQPDEPLWPRRKDAIADVEDDGDRKDALPVNPIWPRRRDSEE